MTEAEEIVDDLNIETETQIFCVYYLRLKTVFVLFISTKHNRPPNSL